MIIKFFYIQAHNSNQKDYSCGVQCDSFAFFLDMLSFGFSRFLQSNFQFKVRKKLIFFEYNSSFSYYINLIT